MTGASPSALLANAAPDPAPGPLVRPVQRVLVLGAGLAGLAAADALGSAGIEAVVLEARARLGGRCHTTSLAGVPVDLGASWIHHAAGNPLTDLAHAHGLATRPFDVAERLGAMRLVEADGSVVDPATTAEVRRLVEQLEAAVAHAAQSLPATTPGPTDADADLASLLDAVALQEAAPAAEAWARFVARAGYETDLAAPAEAIALANYAHESPWGGGDRVLSRGYRGVVDALSARLAVRTCFPVARLVVTDAGVEAWAEEGRVERGSHALVTLPLGVLQAGALCFDPPLPASKRAAIASLGFGRFEKVVLRFASAPWDGAPGGWWKQDEPVFRLWFNLAGALGEPVVVAHVAGPAQRGLAAWDEERRVREGILAFGRVLGHEAPEPVAGWATSWTEDPWCRGAYARLLPGGARDGPQRLAEPLWGRLLFAGEATHATRYGYADGAYASGLREARRLIGAR